MKSKRILFLFILGFLSGVSNVNAQIPQTPCYAGELVFPLDVSMDNDCETREFANSNTVNIYVERNGVKAGSFLWSWRQDSLHNWQALPSTWFLTVDSTYALIYRSDFYYEDNGDYRVIFLEAGTNCSDTLVEKMQVKRAPAAGFTSEDKCYGTKYVAFDSRNPSGVGNTYEWGLDPTLNGRVFKSICYSCNWSPGGPYLVITNADGCRDDAWQNGSLNSVVNLITSSKDTLLPGDTCMLTATSSYPITSISWFKSGVMVGTGPNYLVQYSTSGRYRARIHNTYSSGGCTRDQYIMIYTKNGLRIIEADANIYNAELTVYPNPAIDQITIGGHNQLIEIYNSLGACVRKITTEEINPTISISNLPSGIYFVKSGDEVVRFGK